MQSQLDMFPTQARVETVDPESVRTELVDLLATARSARDAAPWDRRTQRYHRTVFPQMARWLPADEAKLLWGDFEAELDRLEGLLTA